MKATIMPVLIAGLFLLQGFALAGDTNADGASVLQTMSKAKGLIARVPVNAKGEVDTSGAEYRLDLGTGIDSQEALPAAWEKGTDVKGFAEVSQPKGKTDSSTGYYGYYYYTPVVYYTTYYWTFSYPVYYYYYYPTYYYQPYVYYYYVIY